MCYKKCCTARYCPLILAWATTIHKFRGSEAGFGINGEIRYIIADINTLTWKKRCPGTAYVVASGEKTIGQVTTVNPYPNESNLFFEGSMGAHRFTRCLYKDNGEKCMNVLISESWVKYLDGRGNKTKARRTHQYIKSALSLLVNTEQENFINSKTDLKLRIIDIIHNPNDEWKINRKKYLIIN